MILKGPIWIFGGPNSFSHGSVFTRPRAAARLKVKRDCLECLFSDFLNQYNGYTHGQRVIFLNAGVNTFFPDSFLQRLYDKVQRLK